MHLYEIAQVSSSISLTVVILCLAFVLRHHKNYTRLTLVVSILLLTEAFMSSMLTHNAHTPDHFSIRQFFNHISFDLSISVKIKAKAY